jgi:hypothetical protein
MMARILLAVLSVIGFDLFSQSIYSGIVKDSVSSEPLPYVNIGIVNKDVGTVSDKDGKFSIAIDEKFNNDSLRISIVGYKPRTFKVSEFPLRVGDNSEIKLREYVHELPPVVVSGKKMKEAVLGNHTQSKKFRGGFTYSELGNELGIVIKIKKGGAYIKSFNAFIVSNTSDSMQFRLNFYDLENGLPHNKIVSDQIIFPIKTTSGKFVLDLSPYGIKVNDDFFVALELVENFGQKDKRGVLFSAGFFGSPFIARETSQGQWKKYSAVSLGFNVTVQY